jgi:signal transduction histidine kinase
MVDGILKQTSVSSARRSAAEASKLVERAIQQIRSISHLLHPPLLDDVGLLSAIKWYLDGLQDRSGLIISLDVQPPDFRRLAPDLETAIFRIIQEALTNVFRHSGARKARVHVTEKDNQLTVAIRDDGKGVEEATAQLRPGSIGIGIGGMRQRAKELGGELRVTNANPGTLVELTLPLERFCSKGAIATA